MSKDTKVILYEQIYKRSAKAFKTKNVKIHHIIYTLCKEYKLNKLTISSDFPYAFAIKLKKLGIKLNIKYGLFFKEREYKNKCEISEINKVLKITAKGIERGYDILKNSKIKNKKLIWGGKALTSENLRSEIDSLVVKLGAIPNNTIVAGGIQACDPHERGKGVLKPNELIIIDLFPRSTLSGYYGDLTRTYLKGKATDDQKKLWDTVLQAQKKAIKKIKVGYSGKKLQKDCQKFFIKKGYKTEVKNNIPIGFFHGLGHGLGLDLHEEPRLNTIKFKKGHVFTIEPGLYYPKIGGVRHEDVICINDTKAELLSNNLPKIFQI